MSKTVVRVPAEIIVSSGYQEKIRVLHVDDELGLLEVTKECLEMEGPFQVDTASCVEEALEKLKKKRYDAIVSDYKMPNKDGLEFLKEVRQSGSNIPFLIFTGKGREEVAVEALNLGADQYLNKTGDPETVYCELSHAIRRTVERRKAETALNAIEERYKRLFESAVEGIVINGADGRILSVNQAAARLLGYEKPEELIGRPAAELYADPATRPPLLQELMEKGALKDRELIWKKKDGTLIQVLASITVQKDEKGNLLQTEGIVRDVTEKKRAERALAESEEKYRTLVEESLQGIVIAQASNQGSIPRIVFANTAMSKFLGYTPEEMTSFSPQQTMNIVHSEDRELFFGRFKDRLEGRPAQPNYEVRGIRKDGTTIWLELSSLRTEYNGQPAVQAAFIDITARKEMEVELRESEEKYRELVDQLPVIVYEIDLNGRFTFVNEKAFEITGYSSEDFDKGLNILQMVVDKDLGKLKARIRKALCGEKIDSSDYTVLRKDGSTFPAMACASAIVCEGKTVGLRGIVTDITERKKAEEGLTRYNAELSAMLENTKDSIWALDSDGRLLFTNSVFERMFKIAYGVELKKGMRLRELIPESQAESWIDVHRRALEGIHFYFEQTLEVKGTPMAVEVSVNPILDRIGKPVGATYFSRDITERKKEEQKLIESEERFKSLMEEAPIGVCIVDLKGKITYVNKRFEELVGYSREEIIGKNGFTFGIMSDEASTLLANRMKDLLMGKPNRVIEGRFKRKDGEWMWAEIEGRVVKKLGVPVGFQLAIKDITERKEAEEERKRFEESLSALNTYSRNLNIAQSMKEIYSLTLDAMQKVLGFEYADFFMTKENVLCIVDQRGYSKPFPLELPLDGNKRGISIKAAKTGNSIIVKDVRNDIDFVEGLPNMLSELSVPIKIGQKTFGVLNVESKKLDAFDEKDQQLLEILASHAATAITNLEIAKNLEASADDIRKSQQKFEALFIGNPEAAAYLDPDFHILDINPRFSELFGFSLEEIRGRYINDVVVPKDKLEEAETLDAHACQGYAHHNTVRKRKDGSLVPVSISATNLTYGGKLHGYVGVYSDVKDLIDAQEETEEAKKHFQSLFDLMADPVAIVDSKGKVLDTTSRVQEITGYKKEELVGKNILELKLFSAGNKAAMIKSLAKRMLGMRLSPYEVEITTKDGKKIQYEISAAKIDYRGKPADLVVFHDITERKKLEEKLRIVGSLTRHDVRNKVQAITNNIYLVKQKLADNPDIINNFNNMQLTCDQIVQIFEFARDYERLGMEELTFMDLSAMIDKAADSFSDKKGAEVVNECHGISVLADSLLERLFYNLIDNSLKHGGKLTQIRISQEESGDELRLIYEDDGAGISKEIKAKLFTEGFTTGKGTGYGLYLIKRMMEVYGWTIQETGEKGKGARFVMTIPKTNPAGKESYRIA